jgi:hypothetical protein
MYSKAVASRIRQEFWTVLGRYLALHRSSGDEKINWINYKTGCRNLHFRMDADSRTALVAIELAHQDPGTSHLYFERFVQLRQVLHSTLGEEWSWEENVQDKNGRIVSRIFREKSKVNVLDRSDWPDIISFLKPRIIALDQFWGDAKPLFEELGSL